MCVSGLVVELLPATESARVRFPAHAFSLARGGKEKATERIELSTPGLRDLCSATELSGLGEAVAPATHVKLEARHKAENGLSRESNPGPLAPKARIIPLDQTAT